jgi:multidrug efflux pump subunit AcrA (membrane-fusion protein)
MLPLLPGMVVEASIITGSKSIMRYLLKPVQRSLDRAFTEK